MCKKLVLLILVLGLASQASAFQWIQDVSNNWEDSDNWMDGTSQGGMPNLTNARADIYNPNITDAKVININSAAKCSKLQYKYDGAGITLNIQTGSLEVAGSFYGYQLGDGTVNLAAGTTLATGTGVGTVRFGGSGGDYTWNFDGAATFHAAVTIGTYDDGDAILNLGATGTILCDGFDVKADAAALPGERYVDITTGGVITVNGNVRLEALTDRAAGMYKGDGVAGDVSVDYNAGTDTTVIQVPEPATLALLGLGGLLLRKRR